MKFKRAQKGKEKQTEKHDILLGFFLKTKIQWKASDTWTWTWIGKEKLSPILPFPSYPCATPLSLNKPYCAVLPLMTTVPGTAEPEAGLCREGDQAMITFSTEGVKAVWDSLGPEQTVTVYNSELRLTVCLARSCNQYNQCNHLCWQQYKIKRSFGVGNRELHVMKRC